MTRKHLTSRSQKLCQTQAQLEVTRVDSNYGTYGDAEDVHVIFTDPSVIPVSEIPGISSSASSNALNIDNNNNVGIGISTPNAKLNVENSTSGLVASFGDTSDVFAKIWRNSSSDSRPRVGFGTSTAGTQTTLFTASGDTLVADSSGNVGIGTNSPTSRLDVEGGNDVARFHNPSNDITRVLIEHRSTSGGNPSGRAILHFSEKDNPSGPDWAMGTHDADNKFHLNYGSDITSSLLSVNSGGDLDVAGCVTYNGGTSGTCTSDARLKDDIEKVEFGENILEKFIGLTPKKYVYRKNPSNTLFGLIAQDVEITAPELLGERTEDGFYDG